MSKRQSTTYYPLVPNPALSERQEGPPTGSEPSNILERLHFAAGEGGWIRNGLVGQTLHRRR